jgi:membrane protein
MFSHFKVSASWSDIFKRTGKKAMEDDVLGLSAQLGFYFFLALFPALIFLVAVASYFPLDNLIETIIGRLQGVAPPEIVTIVQQQLENVAGEQRGGLLTFGILAALWSASAGMVALIYALNRAFDIEDARPWWKARGTAVLLTIGAGLFVLAATALVLVGPQIAGWIAGQAGLGDTFETAWSIAQWPVVFLLVAVAIALIYYFAPDADQEWALITPGSLLATTVWLIGSLGFSIYLANIGGYDDTYGALGGVIVMLLWLYLSAFAIMIGAELSAAIEHTSPYGKAAGEKRPGERRKLGRLAAREWEERQKAVGSLGGDEREGARAPGEAAFAPGMGRTAPARPAGGRRLGFAEMFVGGVVLATEFYAIVRSRLRKIKS